MAARILAVHNDVRSMTRVPPLVWSESLAAEAARWARYLAQNGYLEHDAQATRLGQGENLWAGTAGAYSYEVMVSDWANEARYFRPGRFPNVSTTGNWEDIGHYTQMVWRQTRALGCAVASDRHWDYLVCRYSNPGNIDGERPF